jgi:NitT/TauT family transport system ATP-binding protein
MSKLELFLEINNLSMSFKSADGTLEVLKDVSFSLGKHEFICVLGPSGSGKTTLLRLTAGLIHATRGEIHFCSGNPLPRLSLMFQQANLMPWRTVYENIYLPLELQGVDAKSARESVRQMVHLVGLEGFEQSWPAELSGGMAQRVALARAFISDPDLLLLDEPFGSLDALTRERMGNELLSLWQARPRPVIMVTHSISEALLLSDRVIVLTPRPGQITLDLAVPLTRPRQEELRYSAAFQKLEKELRKAIV